MAMLPDFQIVDVANLSVSDWMIEPWFKVNHVPLATPTAANASAAWFGSRSGKVASCYSFVRGSTLSSVIKERGSSNVTHTFRFYPSESGSTATATFGFYDKDLSLYSSVYMPDALESGRAVVPFYSRFARIPYSVVTPLTGSNVANLTRVAWDPALTTAQPILTVRNTSGSSVRVAVGRAAADDALASQFVGPPPVTILNSLSTTGPVPNNQLVNQF